MLTLIEALKQLQRQGSEEEQIDVSLEPFNNRCYCHGGLYELKPRIFR